MSYQAYSTTAVVEQKTFCKRRKQKLFIENIVNYIFIVVKLL